MSIQITFDEQLVYRVVLSTDTSPQARLAIGPRQQGDHVSFFDTTRQRSISGKVTGHTPDDPETVCFEQEDGLGIVFEPLTLERFQEIAHDIEGQPRFQSTEEVQSFYRDMAGLS